MSIFRPKYRDKHDKLVESKVYWFEFVYAGKRIRESAKTTRKTLAVECEKRRRLELERAYAGLPVESAAMRINTVLDCTKAYTQAYDQGHPAKSIAWVAERIVHVERLLGRVLLPQTCPKTGSGSIFAPVTQKEPGAGPGEAAGGGGAYGTTARWKDFSTGLA